MCLFTFKMDASNRKRKREFQDLEGSSHLDSSLIVENCGLSSLFLVKKRRKSLSDKECNPTCKVSELIDFAGALVCIVRVMS